MKRKKRLVIRTIVLLIIAVAVGYMLYTSMNSNKASTARVGDQAPNFILSDLDGNEVELADYRGMGVFLNFWGTYCPPCEREMPYMQEQYEVYKSQGVEILAVNVREGKLPVKRFVERYGLTFPIPMDPNADVVRKYGVIPLPTTFLINAEGTVTQVITGLMSESDIQEYMESIKP
ncbi:thiol-disulfide oxidoreductase ResA [Alkalihalobacillus pseudalcaliphilus]|uniref:thiol-disulfide oxidoreductase ResA n=1 Tax=Alkalihalobacillus pseudalcaliphilus TaxID=79884 RepID=UPI00064DB000|nr:thiol-disulfide oxidoreductase ResA [Alkalihalobacillus pseudalcaliphilus]KMK76276.1 thiol-disulfide oxidoreductase [Alkalihalobacillus pseudalcaliphilus]